MRVQAAGAEAPAARRSESGETPAQRKLCALVPSPIGVDVGAVDPLVRLHSSRAVEVVARAVDPFSARNHNAASYRPLWRRPWSNIYDEKTRDAAKRSPVIVDYFLHRRQSALRKTMKDYNDYANYSERRNPSFREPYEEPNKP